MSDRPSEPPGKTWAILPHTRAKLEILRRYLNAWFPILSKGGFPRIVYIDGFAGPGRYAGGEEGSPLVALNAVRQHRLLAPDLLIPECGNILWKKARRKELSSDEAEFAARLLARADIELEPTRVMFDAALKLAVALDHPAYDCIYLALAEARGCDFVTADEAMSRKRLVADTGCQVLFLHILELS